MIRRTSHILRHDASRVIAKPYLPGEEIAAGDAVSRAGLLMARILALPDEEVSVVLQQVLRRFDKRHKQYEALLESHFALVAHLTGDVALSRERRLLIGAYFTNEYSVEGAALFNPSLVPGPDQTGMAAGEQRFVMSLRAVGEGHISSIEFRTGVIDAASALTFDPLGGYLVTGDRALRQAAIQCQAGRARCWERARLGSSGPAAGTFYALRAGALAREPGTRWPAPRDQLRNREDHARAGGVELRHHLPGRFDPVRASDLSGWSARNTRHGGRPVRPLHRG
jgi:hypothetical protein